MSICSREIYVKIPDEKTNAEWGRPPQERSVEDHIRYSLVILDKPRGPSSHEVVAWLKKILGVEVAGHSGTLDPNVSGVLPVAVAEGTKALMALSRADKVYIAVAKFHGDVDEEKLRSVLAQFVGEIYQRPPLRSAVKRQLRTRHVYSLELLELDGRYAVLKMHVEAGTYARKLIHDIGEVLGVSANMRELRRVAVACFDEREAVTLQDVADAMYIWRRYGDDTALRQVLKPIEEIARGVAKIWIKDGAVDAICHGAPLAAPGVVKFETPFNKGDIVAFFTLKNELVAIGRALVSSEELKNMAKGLVARTDRVLMKPGTYPAVWREKKRLNEKSEENRGSSG